jgi:hypothetical protein
VEILENFDFIGIELEKEYFNIANVRINHYITHEYENDDNDEINEGDKIISNPKQVNLTEWFE